MNTESIILMNISKIEKAINMPDRYKIFAQDVVNNLMQTYLFHKKDIAENLKNEVCNTLYKYKDCLDDRILANKNMIDDIDVFLSKEDFLFSENIRINEKKENCYDSLHAIFQKRHTVRNFSLEKVDYSLIEQALNLANNLPSACNRQAGSLIVIENEAIKKEILSLQQGNKGFTAPVLAAIIVDNEVFTQENEDNTKYVYGGSFMAGFVLGLESLGLSSCLLNWHVNQETKNYVGNLLKLNNKEIIVLVYIGYAEENAREAYSFKKPAKEIVEIFK